MPSTTTNSTTQDSQSINLLNKFSNKNNNIVQANRKKSQVTLDTFDDDFDENEELSQFNDYPRYRFAGNNRNLFARNRFNYY